MATTTGFIDYTEILAENEVTKIEVDGKEVDFPMLGSIDPERMETIMNTFLLDFFGIAVFAVRHQVRHVQPSREHFLVAGKNHAAHAFRHRRIQRGDQGAAQVGVEGIDRRTRQPDFADGTVLEDFDESAH